MTVWADGICINQTDVKEKSAQVQQMGMIYELAQHTIIFLGDADSKAQSVINELSLISRYNQHRAAGLIDNNDYSAQHTEQFQDQESQRLAIEHILQKPWFTRVWVLQELVLSSNPWVQFGKSRLRWKVFYSLLLIQTSTPQPTYVPLKRLYDIHHARLNLGPTWLPIANGKSVCDNLLGLLRWRRGAGVTNPRVMIYAHLGMLGGTDVEGDIIEKHLSVDYGKSVGEVYTDAALYFIKSRGGFGILSHVEDVAPECRRQGLPSWVPDWTSAQVPPDVDTHSKEYRPLSDFSLLHTSISTAGVLGSVGYVIGVIKSVKEDFPPIFDLKTMKDSTPKNFVQINPGGMTIKVAKDFKSIDQVLLAHLQAWLGEGFQQPLTEVRFGGNSRCISPTGSVRVVHGDGRIDNTQVNVLLESRESLPRVLPMTNTPKVWDDNRYWTLGYLLMGMLDIPGADERLFPGRKIAFLEDGSLAFVPKFATVGDTICRFNASPVTFVLRNFETDTELRLENEQELDAEILEFFIKNKTMAVKYKDQNATADKAPLFDGKELVKGLDTAKVNHFMFLGECIHDPWGAIITKPSPIILALH